ncbi:MAG: hypothetical protein ACR2IJ_02515 [Fluviibacter sp.]
MASPTYTLINTVTVPTGGSANVTFSSIPATYKDLLIKLSARTTSNYGNTFAQSNMAVNATGNNGDKVLFGYNGTANSNTGGIGSTYGVNSNTSTANTFGNTEFYILNYTGSTTKFLSTDGVAESNSSTAPIVSLNANTFNVTSAITSVTITPETSAGSFAEYTTAYLYGIKNS